RDRPARTPDFLPPLDERPATVGRSSSTTLMPSSSPIASDRLAAARHRTVDLRRRALTQVPEPTSHSRTVVSPAETSRDVPPGTLAKATAATQPVPPASGWAAAVPLSGSHSRTVPSSLPDASSSRPSGPGPNASERTGALWAGIGPHTAVPVWGFH